MTIDIPSLVGIAEILTSGDLIRRITALGINEDNARQLLRRKAGGNGVWRSSHLALPGNSRLFAHENFRKTPGFLTAVIPILEKHRPGLARLAKALEKAEIILRPQAARLLASQNSITKSGNPSLDEEIAAIEELGIGELEAKETDLERLVLPGLFGSDQSKAAAIRAKSQFIAESAIASVLIKQFKEQSLISWNGGSTAEPKEGMVIFNNHFYNAISWSFLQPMLRFDKIKKKRKPSPFALDVYARLCTETDVKGFIDRLNRSRHNPVSGLTFFGAIAAYEFESAAWSAAKGAGLMTINLRQYFGEAAVKAFQQIQALLKSVVGDVSAVQGSDYARLSSCIDQLKTNPWVKDLRSIGFEAVAGLLIKADGWEKLEFRRKVNLRTGEEREVDVCAERGDNAYIIECKAELGSKALAPDYVEKFYTETLPAYISSRWGNHAPNECRAEIWTTGTINADAHASLQALSLKRFVKPALLDRNQIKTNVPRSLSSCKRLIESIAGVA